MKTDEIMALVVAFAADYSKCTPESYRDHYAVIEAALKEREAPPKAQPMPDAMFLERLLRDQNQSLRNQLEAAQAELALVTEMNKQLREQNTAVDIACAKYEAALAAKAQTISDVGDSEFEGWFSDYDMANKGTKQQMRDAYAAGISDAERHHKTGERHADR